MRFNSLLAALLLLASLSSSLAAALEVGEPAPDFLFEGTDGSLHRLSEHLGQRGVIIAWFPKAFTPGWTQELAALRDSAQQLAEYEVALYMVSLDDPEKNAAFAASLGALLPVVSDQKGIVAKRYGVLALGGLYARRWTFYIDVEGRVRAIDKKVSAASAGVDMLRKLEELGFPKRGSQPIEPRGASRVGANRLAIPVARTGPRYGEFVEA